MDSLNFLLIFGYKDKLVDFIISKGCLTNKESFSNFGDFKVFDPLT